MIKAIYCCIYSLASLISYHSILLYQEPQHLVPGYALDVSLVHILYASQRTPSNTIMVVGEIEAKEKNPMNLVQDVKNYAISSEGPKEHEICVSQTVEHFPLPKQIGKIQVNIIGTC